MVGGEKLRRIFERTVKPMPLALLLFPYPAPLLMTRPPSSLPLPPPRL